MQSPHDLVQTIHAAHNLVIEVGPDRWRLVNGAHATEPLVAPAFVEAHPGGIDYVPAFARARQLPEGASIAPSEITRVVVGWAPETESWHLGLMLATPDGEQAMRWIGLASWPAGDVTAHEAKARQAAQALADIIGRPLHVVEPPAPKAPESAPQPASEANVITDTRPPQATTPYEVSPDTRYETPAAPRTRQTASGGTAPAPVGL